MQTLDHYPCADEYARVALVTYVGLAGEPLERPRVLACGSAVGRQLLETDSISLHHFGRVTLSEPGKTLKDMAPAAIMVSVAMQPRVREMLAREPDRPIVAIYCTENPVVELRRPR